MRYEIAKLELRDGDTVVVKTDLHLTMDQAKALGDRVKEFTPNGIKVLVLASGVTLEILRKQSDAKTDAP
jgi:hypothetical protein